MGRDIEGLSRAECWELLAHSRSEGSGLWPRLNRSSCPSTTPSTAPPWCSGPLRGGKLNAAIQGQRVVFQVEDLSTRAAGGWSVLVKGVAGRVHDPVELERARRLELQPWAPGDRPHLVRIGSTSISGRRIPPGTQFEKVQEAILVAVTDEAEIARLRGSLPTPD